MQAVDGDHNRALKLARDGVMRGGLGAGKHDIDARNAAPPSANPAHDSRYSALHDGSRRESAALCGACHDVVSPAGVALERTFAEWRSSRFNSEDPDHCRPAPAATWPATTGRAVAGAPTRELHRHLWPGVDVTLENDFPGASAQAAAIACAFKDSLQLDLAKAADAVALERVTVTLTNARIGHAFPSGAAQDRRAWVELVAYDADDNTVFERGVVDLGEVVGERQPELEVLRDRLFDAEARPVHMFWQAAASEAHPRGYETQLLPVPAPRGAPATRTSQYDLPAATVRVRARLRVQSIGLDVLDDFQGVHLPISEGVIRRGYQGPRTRVPTITVPGTERELTLGVEGISATAPDAGVDDCGAQGYVSLLEP